MQLDVGLYACLFGLSQLGTETAEQIQSFVVVTQAKRSYKYNLKDYKPKDALRIRNELHFVLYLYSGKKKCLGAENRSSFLIFNLMNVDKGEL